MQESIQLTSLYSERLESIHDLSGRNKAIVKEFNNAQSICMNDLKKDLRFSLRPFVISPSDNMKLALTIEQMWHILEKTVDAFVSGKISYAECLEEALPFEDLIKLKHPESYQSIGRYDFIIDKDFNLKFNEFNGASPGGTAIFGAAYRLAHAQISPHNNNLALHRFCSDQMTTCLIRSFAKMHPECRDDLVVLLYDSHKLTYEFDYIAKELTSNGFSVKKLEAPDIVPLASTSRHPLLVYNNMFVGGRNLNMDALSPWTSGEYQDVTSMILSGRIKLFHNLGAASVIENKKIFHVLHKYGSKYLNEDEVDFVKKHIPKTAVLTPNTDLLEFAENKNSFLLKKGLSGLSLSTVFGCDLSQKQWELALNEVAKTSNWVAQERVAACPLDFTNDLTEQFYSGIKSSMSAYVYHGKYAGFISRLSPDNKVNVSGHEAGILQPTFLHKNNAGSYVYG